MRQLICSAAIGVAVAVAPMSGCALLQRSGQSSTSLTETQKYQVATQAYISAVNLMTRLVNSGSVGRKDAESFEVIRASANQLLSDWQIAITNGTPFNSIEALDRILDELIRAAAQADRTHRDLVKGGKS